MPSKGKSHSRRRSGRISPSLSQSVVAKLKRKRSSSVSSLRRRATSEAAVVSKQRHSDFDDSLIRSKSDDLSLMSESDRSDANFKLSQFSRILLSRNEVEGYHNLFKDGTLQSRSSKLCVHLLRRLLQLLLFSMLTVAVLVGVALVRSDADLSTADLPSVTDLVFGEYESIVVSIKEAFGNVSFLNEGQSDSSDLHSHPDWWVAPSQVFLRRFPQYSNSIQPDHNSNRHISKSTKENPVLSRHPVLIVPGFSSTKLEVWRSHNRELDQICGQGYGLSSVRKQIWGGASMLSSVLMNPQCWLSHMSLNLTTGMDLTNVSVRPSQSGLDSADKLIGDMYWLWSPLIDNLATIGYTPEMIAMAPYDWRLGFPMLEQRDGFLTELKYTVEKMVRQRERHLKLEYPLMTEIERKKESRVSVVTHSLGGLLWYYFMQWVEHPRFGDAGMDWVDRHIHRVSNIAVPFLGVPKSLPTFLSGETMETAAMNPPMRLMKDYLIPRTWMNRFVRSVLSGLFMFPIGGARIWGDGIQGAPEERAWKKRMNQLKQALKVRGKNITVKSDNDSDHSNESTLQSSSKTPSLGQFLTFVHTDPPLYDFTRYLSCRVGRVQRKKSLVNSNQLNRTNLKNAISSLLFNLTRSEGSPPASSSSSSNGLNNNYPASDSASSSINDQTRFIVSEDGTTQQLTAEEFSEAFKQQIDEITQSMKNFSDSFFDGLKEKDSSNDPNSGTNQINISDDDGMDDMDDNHDPNPFDFSAHCCDPPTQEEESRIQKIMQEKWTIGNWWQIFDEIDPLFASHVRSLIETSFPPENLPYTGDDPSMIEQSVDLKHLSSPLWTALPKVSKHSNHNGVNQDAMKIYCLYGTGLTAERSYLYTRDYNVSMKYPFRIQTEFNDNDLQRQLDEMKVDQSQLKKIWKPKQPWFEWQNGIALSHGDGTVPVLTLGGMCEKGWKNNLRWNPSNLTVVTREYRDSGESLFDRGTLRGGPKSSDHVDILGNVEMLTDLLHIATSKDDNENYVTWRVNSELLEILDFVHF